MTTEDRCPLCGSGAARSHAEVNGRPYLRCGTCDLVWLLPSLWPDRDTELKHYGTHENDPSDPGYRKFLSRLADPLCVRLPAGARGLDYGCGPGPTLSVMLEERGFSTAVYDPFFAPDITTLDPGATILSPAPRLRSTSIHRIGSSPVSSACCAPGAGSLS